MGYVSLANWDLVYRVFSSNFAHTLNRTGIRVCCCYHIFQMFVNI